MSERVDKKNYHRLHLSTSCRCENNCIFCMEEKRLAEPSLDEAKKILQENKSLKRMVFTSGEPLMNKNFNDLVALAEVNGYDSIGLITNGRKLSELKLCRDIIKHGLNQITISLHGHDKATHESNTRTEGSFDETLKAIKNISDIKDSNDIQFKINCTITKLNYKHIGKIYEILSQYNIDTINFNFVEPRGRAKKFFNSVVPTYTDVCEVLRESGIMKGNIHASLSGVPQCIAHKLNVELGVTEKWHIKVNEKYKIYAPKNKKKLSSCKDCAFDAYCEGIWTEYLKHYGEEEFRPIMRVVEKNRNAGYIQITRKCDRECVFCSNPYIDHTLTLNEIRQQIDSYIESGVTEIVFTGGEPTLNDALPESISYCKSKGVDCRLITNGNNLANEGYAKKLANAGLSNINISVYSHDRKVQDKLTKTDGSLEKTMMAIRNSIAHISVPVINITINDLNAENLDETAKAIIKKFPELWHFVFNNMDPTGRALENKWSIPRLVKMELGLNRALTFLKSKGKSFRVERVPLCYMQGFEEFSTETRKLIKNETYRCLFLNENDREFREIRNFRYDKATCCSICSLDSICAGLNPRYVKLYGTKELFPIFTDREAIIRKVK